MGKICRRSLPRMADSDGNTLHNRSFIIRNANSWKVFPRKTGYMGKNIFSISNQVYFYSFLFIFNLKHDFHRIFKFFQFHSHQIFHCFVIAGAFVHYHGISLMALYRLQKGDCPMEPVNEQCIIDSIHNSHMLANHTDWIYLCLL